MLPAAGSLLRALTLSGVAHTRSWLTDGLSQIMIRVDDISHVSRVCVVWLG